MIARVALDERLLTARTSTRRRLAKGACVFPSHRVLPSSPAGEISLKDNKIDLLLRDDGGRASSIAEMALP
eukprot:SAG31_NODE_303_length_18065_cov_5.733107_25_plen_71_part_00